MKKLIYVSKKRRLNPSYFSSAFTLAEVLITLGIIGVVCAITIPTLIKNTQNAELITRFKKTFSVLNGATKMIVVNTGDLDTSSVANILTQYKAVMNSTKDATFNDGVNFSPTKIYFYYKSKDAVSYAASADPGFVTNDGVSLMFANFNATCGSTITGVTNVCGIWYIDLNGAKPPNMWGYDFFQIPLIYRNGEYRIIPFGAGNGDTSDCVIGSSYYTTSNGCAARALKDALP